MYTSLYNCPRGCGPLTDIYQDGQRTVTEPDGVKVTRPNKKLVDCICEKCGYTLSKQKTKKRKRQEDIDMIKRSMTKVSAPNIPAGFNADGIYTNR